MTLLYESPDFLLHDTGMHPERRQRIEAISARLESSGLREKCQRPSWQLVLPDQMTLVHDAHYVKRLENYATSGGGRIEVDTVVSPRSFEIARLAAGAVCDAVRRVTAGEDTSAFCAVRPPGHHALPDAPMGFCLLNNVAIGARFATQTLGLDRVLVVDWDVHHGNGTQDTFWRDEQVGFLSIHRAPFYPGTGDEDEVGSGPGVGTTVNVPIAYGTTWADYAAQFTRALESLAAKMRPQLIVLSAGFDAHHLDPVGSLRLESEHFTELTKIVRSVADAHAQGKLVSVLEGGYHVQALAECVELHLRELLVKEAEDDKSC